ncbi:hypothetical protein VPHF86_0210 [Vibrio phage F86]
MCTNAVQGSSSSDNSARLSAFSIKPTKPTESASNFSRNSSPSSSIN